MSSYSTILPWSRVARTVARLARPELPLQALLVGIGLLLSLSEGISLTLGLLLVYRILDAARDFGIDGVAGELIHGLASLSVYTLGALAVATVLLSTVLNECSRVVGEVIANRVTHRARTQIYAVYLSTTYEQASRHGHGAMLDILDYEAPFLKTAVLNVTGVIIASCSVAVYGSYLIVLSPLLGLTILVLGVALGATLGLSSRLLSRLGSRISVLNERLLAHTIATVEGLRTVRLHAVEPRFIERYDDASGELSAAHVRLARAHSIVSTLRQLLKLVAFAALIWIAVGARVHAATVVMVLALLFRVIPYVGDLERRIMLLFDNHLPLSIVANELDPARLQRPSSGERPFPGLKRELRFDDVRFAHTADAQVLDGVSFTIPAGALVTLIGPSGGGKTTLINLLARLYEPQGGEILVDGVPLTAFERQSWLGRLGFSGQDIDLQQGTILDNVRFDDARVSEADAWWALGVAQAAEFIHALPEGIQTMVGDRGLRLSGGQRQRIGLARAIARRPDLLILDEATNAVDIAVEATIYRSIRAALPTATILVITHRSAIDTAVVQFVLNDRTVTSRALAGAPA